jgi:dienelactone hydrolase
MRSITCGLAALWMLASLAVASSATDLDVVASDGAKLKATYSSPGKPGPGMLLIHQCNRERSSWSALTDDLVAAGVHVLSMDLRGFGESPGEPMTSRESFQALMQKSPGDVDAALALLLSQQGVDASRVGAGGASCGAMLTADLASRDAKVKTLMLLSGPPSEAAVAHIAATPGLSVFVAAATGDTVTPGVADALRSAVDGSKNESSTARIVEGTEHGLPMFDKNPELGPALVSWLTAQLNR